MDSQNKLTSREYADQWVDSLVADIKQEAALHGEELLRDRSSLRNMMRLHLKGATQGMTPVQAADFVQNAVDSILPITEFSPDNARGKLGKDGPIVVRVMLLLADELSKHVEVFGEFQSEVQNQIDVVRKRAAEALEAEDMTDIIKARAVDQHFGHFKGAKRASR
jgi:hypothetical protein